MISLHTKGQDMNTLIPRIMVAEDSVDLRTLIERVLRKNGFEVEAYEDGSKALSQLTEELNRKEVPSLIITDISMPVMDGRELIERIRKIHDLDDVQILVYSSEKEIVDHKHDPVMGTHELRKPALPKELVATIRDLLGESSAA